LTLCAELAPLRPRDKIGAKQPMGIDGEAKTLYTALFVHAPRFSGRAKHTRSSSVKSHPSVRTHRPALGLAAFARAVMPWNMPSRNGYCGQLGQIGRSTHPGEVSA